MDELQSIFFEVLIYPFEEGGGGKEEKVYKITLGLSVLSLIRLLNVLILSCLVTFVIAQQRKVYKMILHLRTRPHTREQLHFV